MQALNGERDETTLDQDVSRQVMALRLATGLLQGLLMYWIYRSGKDYVWPATEPYLYVPLLLAGLILPVLLVSSMGKLAPRKAAGWVLAALLVLLAVCIHDVWRSSGAPVPAFGGAARPVVMPSAQLAGFCVVFFYIAQSLVLAGAQDGRVVARYATYFETAWKLAIQVKFSAFFTGVLWMVLSLGSALFVLVKLEFLRRLMEESWFVVPVICCAFSWGMHITDVRPAIVRGIRTLLLVLMSWILPLAALLIAAFLCSLPFTGLEALWQTRHATAVLLAADAVLVVLINAAFQNGAAAGVAAAVRLSARLAAVLILPLTCIAVYALALRVGDYGWTADRIIAAACLVVAGCYAVGYAYAAYRYRNWLAGIAPVNVAAAFAVLAVLLALFTPIADPARISVADQMARLHNGRIAAAKFDFISLHFDGARYGRAALDQLKAATGPDAALLHERAERALAMLNRWEVKQELPRISIAANLRVWPATATLPDSFVRQDWRPQEQLRSLPACLTHMDSACDAFLVDVDGDGRQEIMLVDAKVYPQPVLFGLGADGAWSVVGRLQLPLGRCPAFLDRMKSGQFALAPPRMQDLEVGGQSFQLQREYPATDGCKAIK